MRAGDMDATGSETGNTLISAEDSIFNILSPAAPSWVWELTCLPVQCAEESDPLREGSFQLVVSL